MEDKTLCSKEQSSYSEGESGWTSYFEDFKVSEKRKASEAASCSSCSSSLHEAGSSMVSDAASCTAWKTHHITGEIAGEPLPPPERLGNLSLKRKMGRGVLGDDSLEDTASSPVNSPKVGEFKVLEMKTRKKEESKEKMSGSGDCKGHASEGIKEANYTGIVDQCSEIRKQGLCLVPISMLANYLG
ncbi:uncharacterized protein LOC110034087 [Phalaenopsis equestris]|uniref:uncharacterized protein LOC110034087 n=1 Tax=Phalaenopsis equestris TaxID=78828 RepID=UPI0009E1C156|nr:uncharacterized protein LOC110034087 [Phalaenopsis equestris]